MLPLFLSLLSVLQSPGQIPTPRVKVQVNLALVDVQVAEKGTGRIVVGLDNSDFVLKDNGESREVAVLERESVPLDLFLLWDTSSGPGGYPEDVYDGPPKMLQQLEPADRMGVISFSIDVRLQAALTEERGLILSAIHRALYSPGYYTDVWGRDFPQRIYASNIHGALIAASHLLVGPRTEPRRRAVFVVTHNRGAFSRSSADEVITALLEADVTVEALAVYQEGVALPTVKGHVHVIGKRAEMEQKRWKVGEGITTDPIAEATGGEIFHYDATTPTKGWWREAIQRLRSRYLLGFYVAPSNSKKREFRTIQVELSEKAKAAHPDALVRAPRGYYISSDDPPRLLYDGAWLPCRGLAVAP